MNTLCTRLLISCLLFVSITSKGQDNTEVFNENVFALRHSFTRSYSVNFELSNRAFVYNDDAVLYKLRQVQISHFSALKLDVGETYLVVTNEGLLTSAKAHKPEIEYRISPSIGVLLSEDLNLEFGVELRLDELNIKTEESIFLNTSIELKL